MSFVPASPINAAASVTAASHPAAARGWSSDSEGHEAWAALCRKPAKAPAKAKAAKAKPKQASKSTDAAAGQRNQPKVANLKRKAPATAVSLEGECLEGGDFLPSVLEEGLVP